MKKGSTTIAMLSLVIVGMFASGCGNVVPPGTTVLLIHATKPSEIVTEGVYHAWGRTKVYFVDQKLEAFTVDRKILCADEINMDVSAKWLGNFMVTASTLDTIKTKIQATPTKRGDISGLELSLNTFWQKAMLDRFSSTLRDVVSTYKTDNIREKRLEIQSEVKKRYLEWLAGAKYPVETVDIMITNLDYPTEVTAMRNKIKQEELRDLENAAIATANVAKARRDAELEAERGKAALVKAEADAAANRVRAASLTPEILAVKQLETLVELAAGPNNNTVVIPFQAIIPQQGQNASLVETMLLKESLDETAKAIKTTAPKKQ